MNNDFKTTVSFTPVFVAGDGITGVSFACDTQNEAISCLMERKKNLATSDLRQFVKVTTVEYREIILSDDKQNTWPHCPRCGQPDVVRGNCYLECLYCGCVFDEEEEV